jgi:fatty-acyl-CoA synthase
MVTSEAEGRIDRLLDAAADHRREQVSIAFGSTALTYGELDRLVDQLVGKMRAGARRDDLAGARVAVISPNSPLLVATLFAAWRVGAVAVPLNARLREHELSQILADAEPVVVVSVPEHLGYRFTDLLPRLLRSMSSVRACLFAGPEGEIAAEVAGKQQSVTSEETAGASALGPDVAAVLYTSGTTGTPKGALVTHGREVGGARELAGVLELAPDDGVALVIPVSHAFGLTCLLATVAAGARAILVESTTTLRPLRTAIDRHGVTVLHGSPALFVSLLKSPPGGLPGIRTGFVAGAPSAPDLQERLDAIGVLNLYGLTETGAVACCRPGDPPERRRTTAGRALPGMELRVANGELQVRGPAVTPGYFHRPEETAVAFDEDWFRTGDAAEIEGGYLRISGRLKELVHVGGFNVFPAEVEAVLLTHPDVLQAAVVGAADERMGEVLRAFVVARPGSDLTAAALLGFARGRIAGYKLPYAIRLLPDLPLLPSGKPDRRALGAR